MMWRPRAYVRPLLAHTVDPVRDADRALLAFTLVSVREAAVVQHQGHLRQTPAPTKAARKLRARSLVIVGCASRLSITAVNSWRCGSSYGCRLNNERIAASPSGCVRR